MSDNKAMREVYQLIQEERYREAREVLETESIEDEVREKWLRWMADLHREERVMAGVLSDKTKANAEREIQAEEEIGGFIAGTLLTLVAGLLASLLIAIVFTTPSIWFGGWMLVGGVVLGFIGWQRVGHLLNETHGAAIGVVAFMSLMVYVMSSGIPVMYYYEIPVNYVAAMAFLVLPGVAGISWSAGTWLGTRAARLRRKLTG